MISRRGPWRNIDAVEYATLEWLEWFNHRRLLEPIGNIPSAGLEAAYYRQQEESAMGHDTNKLVSGKPGAVQSATRTPGEESVVEIIVLACD